LYISARGPDINALTRVANLTGIACPVTCFATGSGENNMSAVILSRS